MKVNTTEAVVDLFTDMVDLALDEWTREVARLANATRIFEESLCTDDRVVMTAVLPGGKRYRITVEKESPAQLARLRGEDYYTKRGRRKKPLGGSDG